VVFSAAFPNALVVQRQPPSQTPILPNPESVREATLKQREKERERLWREEKGNVRVRIRREGALSFGGEEK